MAKLKVPFLVQLPGAGGYRYYWQPSSALRAAGWRPERLPDDRRQALARADALNHSVAEWRAGRAGIPGLVDRTGAPLRTVAGGTLSDVIRRYQSSRYWLDLRERTRRSYRHDLAYLEAWAGDKPVAGIKASHVETLYSTLHRTKPSKAVHVIAMLRTVLAHAVRLDLVPVNVARHPGVSAPAKSGRIWPRAAVAAMIRTADAMGHHSIGTAIAMAHWLGQRQGDVLTAPRSAWSGGRIQLTQSKTGARVTIPENPALAQRLEAERACQAVRWPGLVPRYLILREGTDKPWPAEAFSHTFAEIRAALALEQSSFPLPDGSSVATASLWFMHLRHTAVTELATAGATALQISGITGHAPATVEQILSHYLVRTGDLADAAQAKRLAWQDRLG